MPNQIKPPLISNAKILQSGENKPMNPTQNSTDEIINCHFSRLLVCSTVIIWSFSGITNSMLLNSIFGLTHVNHLALTCALEAF